MQKLGEWRKRKEVRGNQGIDEEKMFEKLEKLEKMLMEQKLESQYKFEKMFEKMLDLERK